MRPQSKQIKFFESQAREWVGKTLTPGHWDAATAWFMANPQRNKFSRKRDNDDLKLPCSFIKLGEKVYALYGIIDEDSVFSKVKWAYSKEGALYACKMINSKGRPKLKPDKICREAALEQEFGVLVAEAKRADADKHMRLLNYLGINLLDLINLTSDQGLLCELQYLLWLLAASDALELVHRGQASLCGKPYVHLDVKPDNFVVDCDGRMRMIDFGHALRFEDLKDWVPDLLPAPGDDYPEHIAPEIKHHGRVSPATDVYAFGEMMKEALPIPRLFCPSTKLKLGALVHETQKDSPEERLPLLVVQVQLLLMALDCYNVALDDSSNKKLFEASLFHVVHCLMNYFAAVSLHALDARGVVARSVDRFQSNPELWGCFSAEFKLAAKNYMQYRR